MYHSTNPLIFAFFKKKVKIIHTQGYLNQFQRLKSLFVKWFIFCYHSDIATCYKVVATMSAIIFKTFTHCKTLRNGIFDKRSLEFSPAFRTSQKEIHFFWRNTHFNPFKLDILQGTMKVLGTLLP